MEPRPQTNGTPDSTSVNGMECRTSLAPRVADTERQGVTMKPPKRSAPDRDDRLLSDIAELRPFPDRLDCSRRASGVILKQMRERAGLRVDDVGPLYAAAYRRMFPNQGDSSVSANTIRNWEKGNGDPQHGLRSFFALFAVYILAAPNARPISHEHVENALFLYGFRRLHLEEIGALFPDGPPGPTATTGDRSQLGSMRRYADNYSADKYYDDRSVEDKLMRNVAWIVSDPERPVLHGRTIDELESETRRVARSGADATAFMKVVAGLVRAIKAPTDDEVMSLVRMFTDRISEDRETSAQSESPRNREHLTSPL